MQQITPGDDWLRVPIKKSYLNRSTVVNLGKDHYIVAMILCTLYTPCIQFTTAGRDRTDLGADRGRFWIWDFLNRLYNGPWPDRAQTSWTHWWWGPDEEAPHTHATTIHTPPVCMSHSTPPFSLLFSSLSFILHPSPSMSPMHSAHLLYLLAYLFIYLFILLISFTHLLPTYISSYCTYCTYYPTQATTLTTHLTPPPVRLTGIHHSTPAPAECGHWPKHNIDIKSPTYLYKPVVSTFNIGLCPNRSKTVI